LKKIEKDLTDFDPNLLFFAKKSINFAAAKHIGV